MEILYKDSDLVVCYKPSGVLSAKDLSGKTSMPDLLKEELDCKEVYPVHRLDKEVSGLMVYALSSQSASKLSSKTDDFNKEYIALVSGCPSENEGIFEDLLFKDSSKNKTFVVKKERRGVKKAKLSYTVAKKLGDYTLVRIKLFTGRTHQIRVQFSSRGMSILGDRKYGGKPSDKGIALRSVYLSFIHPTTNKRMTFEQIPEISELY
ncbi:MAG: RluA family pseudouridine synthase [Ruminococcaceae bacterium]|nr:RluA family pseudouridine synthase [Oscillospiraceae bacterium]